MTIAQFNRTLDNTLSEAGIEQFTPLQEAIIARAKSGGDAVFVCKHDAALQTGITLAAILKAPQAFEGSPRVLLLSPSIDDVHNFRDQLTNWTRRTEIAVELVHDKGNMVLERNNVFEGADIIVGNPKRVLDLYTQNGIHVNQLTLLMVHATHDILVNPIIAQTIIRLVESLPAKCQRILFTETVSPRFEKFSGQICRHAKTLEFDFDTNAATDA